MRKVSLHINEKQKYQIIKELAEHAGNKQRAALKLGLTLRTIDRLLAAYRCKGKAASVHRNRRRSPANSLSKEMSDSIVSLYREKYDGFNFAHYKDVLQQHEDITVSYFAAVIKITGITSKLIRLSKSKDRLSFSDQLDESVSNFHGIKEVPWD